MVQLVQRRTENKKEKKSTRLKKQALVDPMNIDKQGFLAEQPLGGEKKQNELGDSQDERLFLTLEDQENLLKEVAIGGEIQGTGTWDKEFEEEISDRLGELHKQQQLNIDIALRTSQAQPGT